jgi:hypothetical protein
MTKRTRPSKPIRKVTTKSVLPDLKAREPQAIRGGTKTSSTTRRKDPYSNFNF